MRDARLLYAAAFLRSFTFGVLGVLLAFHLTSEGFDPARIGHVVSAGLVGIAVGTAAAGFLADRVGRRRVLLVLTLAGVLALGVVAFMPSPVITVIAAFLGLVNGAGRDRGAQLTLEQAMLAATTTPDTRTRSYAVYNIAQDTGGAFGAAAVVLLKWLSSLSLIGSTDVGRAGILLSAALGVVGLVCYARLSSAVESAAGSRPPPLSPQTRVRVAKLSALFAVDSLAGGLLTATFMTMIFHGRFHVSEGVIGALFVGARILNALSHMGAAWLSKRIGLVNTMVFTHTPSSLLLITIAVTSSFPVAAGFFLLREGLVEMDVPTRQSYVNGIVADHERTRVNAITNLVRMLAWAVAAEVSGRLLAAGSFWIPLVVCASMKVAYDMTLWVSFRKLKPPEETATA